MARINAWIEIFQVLMLCRQQKSPKTLLWRVFPNEICLIQMYLLYNSTGALFSVFVKALINYFSLCSTDLKQQVSKNWEDMYFHFPDASQISVIISDQPLACVY